jgi:hypothetical protein
VKDFGATRETILRSLHAKDYVVTEDHEGFWVTVNVSDRPVRWFIPQVLGRRYTNETIKHFGIPKEWIDNPLLIPGEEEGNKPC